MKKLIAAALTGALVLGTVGTSVVFAADDDKTITVAASETPHSEILEAAKPILEEEGYDLEVTVFDDYVQPNEVVESGDFDANYFQHIPYLNSFNEEKGTHLVNAGGIHYEPFGIYPGTKSSLDDIADGDTIAVPNDTTNEARALLLLQDNGIIKLKDGAGLEATVNDIEENPYNVEIVELAAEQVARVAEETSYIVLNGNYALQAGYSVSKDALAYETSDSEAAKTYVNVIAVKEGNENSDKIKALVDVLKFITLISTIMAKSWNHEYRDGGERAWTPMNKESLTAKLLDLVEGRETPESWRNWWDEHEPELETLLSRGEFLKLKPCRHGFQWVPVFGSQKGAIAILEKSGTAFEASNLYQERYLAELDAFCKEQKRVQREKQKEFKASHPELFGRYPKFSKALAKVLDPSDEIKPATTEEQIGNQESVMDFTLPAQVREFFLLTAGINVFTGVIVELSGTFNLTIHGERYCVLGEFWKEADGDQLLLRPGEETIWYYAHEQDKVKRLCNDMTELLEKKLARYLNEQ